MKCVGICSNKQRDKEHALRMTLVEALEAKGVVCKVFEEPADAADDNEIELLAVMGGDGTILSASRAVAGKVPIFGINTGNVGFLSEITPQDIVLAAGAIARNEGEFQNRMMITSQGKRANGEAIPSFDALNEFSFVRSSSLKMVQMDVFIGDDFAYRCHSDGLLISTPTGSTAYNMSAGGPVVYPTARCMLVTPVCAHSLTVPGVVVGDKDIIKVRITGSEPVYLCVDNRHEITLTAGDELTFEKSRRTADFYILGKYRFFDKMREKLCRGAYTPEDR